MSIELLDLSSSGIEFHSLSAATANALSFRMFSVQFLGSPEGVERTIFRSFYTIHFMLSLLECTKNPKKLSSRIGEMTVMFPFQTTDSIDASLLNNTIQWETTSTVSGRRRPVLSGSQTSLPDHVETDRGLVPTPLGRYQVCQINIAQILFLFTI